MSLLDDASLLVTPNAYKEGKLYSIIPTNGNGDFSVTRATTATRVNAAGLVELVPYNLVQYSEMFADAYWAKNFSTISANVAIAPNGTLTADKFIPNATNNFHSFNSPANLSTTNTTATFSVYMKADGYNFGNVLIANSGSYTKFFEGVFNLSNGTIEATGRAVGGYTGTRSIESVGNGWYRCSVTLTNADANSTHLVNVTTQPTNNPNVTYTGNGTSGILVWGAQFEMGALTTYQATETRLNIPRLDYSLGSCPNILLEPQRTNLNTFSEEFNNATFWLRGTGVSVNANTSNSPSGTLTADTITGATGPFVWTGAGTFFRSYTTLSVSTAYTFSAYLKGTGSVTMTWRDGTTGGNNSLVCNLTSSWQRFEITRTTGAATSNMAIIFHSASGNFDAWGGQMELGAYQTSYIPTTSASVTRNADVISRGNIFTNGLITASGGTWFVELRNNRVLTRDGGANLTQSLGLKDSFGNGIVLRTVGTQRHNVSKYIANTPTELFITTADICKIAIKWNGATLDIFQNGVKVVSGSIFTTINMTTLETAVADIPKFINSMALFPTPLTDTQCIALTT